MEPEFFNKSIMVVGAHPDDNDFGSGATVAKAAVSGARVIYIIATGGQRGSSDPQMTPERLAQIRMSEQHCAAEVLGVKQVRFFDYIDGELVADLELKEKIVRVIREHRPEIVFTMDPSFYYYKDFGVVNHSDHRAIGTAVLDACYPLARDLLSFPEHREAGLEPHKVRDVLMHSFSLESANCFVDVSDTLQKKLDAIACHTSQVDDATDFAALMERHAAEAGKRAGCRYAEAFVRLQLPS
jgi:LmbE family N-acetylglucosaminyl deacetylase